MAFPSPASCLRIPGTPAPATDAAGGTASPVLADPAAGSGRASGGRLSWCGFLEQFRGERGIVHRTVHDMAVPAVHSARRVLAHHDHDLCPWSRSPDGPRHL